MNTALLIDVIGFCAGTLTSIGCFPQLVRCWMTKQTDDISIWMPFLMSFGCFLWLLYGYFLHSWPLILTNLVAFVANMTLLGLCLWYRRS